MSSQPSKTSRESLHEHLFSAIAVLVIVLFGLLFATYGLYDRKITLSNGEKSAQQIADHTALIAEGALESSRQLLHAMDFLARAPGPSKSLGNPAIRNGLLELKAKHPHIMDLLIVSADSRIENWTGNGPPPDIRDRDYYAYHVQQPGSDLYVGKPLLSKVHKGSWFFALSEAVRDGDGNLRHVLVANIDVTLMHQLLNARLAIPQSTQVLLSADGMIYTRTPNHDEFVGKKIVRTPEMKSLTAENPTATGVRISQLDQKQRVFTVRRLANYPMVAAGSISVDELLAAWKLRMWLLAILWLLLSAGIAWIIRRANAFNRAQARMAMIDSLTGVHNRGSIINTASRLQRSQENTGSLSLLMIDADHFKDINDRFGHLVGDDVLRQLSEVLRTQLRSTDIVGRYGGEEFLVLMPDTGHEGALLLAEKLRKSVEKRITRPLPVTVSIGVATTSEDDMTLDETLSRADKALYLAKAEGRNCIRSAD